MSTTTKLLLLAVAILAASCAATGPISAPVAAGAAALIAVFDQLLAGGVIDPMQHMQLTQGIGAIQGTVASVQQGIEVVKAAQAGSITTTEAITGLGGTAVAIVGGLNAWRNKTRKKALRVATA